MSHRTYKPSLTLALVLGVIGLILSASQDGFAADTTPKISAEERSQNCPKDKIKFGGLDWDSNTFHVKVASFIIKNGYGCDIDVIPGTTLPMLTALGRGDIDILMEVWEDSIQEAWDKLVSDGRVSKIGVNFPDAIQGFFVPTYLIKGDEKRGIEAVAPDLVNVADLPAYKLLFKDEEVPDKGRFHNCSLGWACETINTKKLQAYGLLEDYTNFRPGTGSALSAAIASNYERGTPFLAYYWGPTWVLGKYDLTMLQEPEYDKAAWQQFMKTDNPSSATAYPLVEVIIGANTGLKKKAPSIAKFLSNYRTSNKIISDALGYMQAEKGRTMEDAAMYFLKTSQSWQEWVPPIIAERVKVAAGLSETEEKPWSIDIATPINDLVLNLVRNYQPFFTAIGDPIRQLILWTEACLFFIPIWVFIITLAVGCFFLGGLKLALISVLGLGLIYVLALWALAVQTLALMIISTLVCIVIGLPTGILLARSYRVRSVVLPLLDAMQTMPSFVYLIPALMLFGLGKVPALFATVIYAVAPMIKLTDLGIRKVDVHVIEASRSFGSSPKQLLFGVQLPLALPTIMAGLNQTIMLALSMVVVASMIGARGLGEQVLLGIQKLDVGQGFTAGLGIVALAIVLDRITQKIGHKLGN